MFDDLGPTQTRQLRHMFETLEWKAVRNRRRRDYYYFKQRLKDLDISIPPRLKTLETVVGWPAKAVDSLARRTLLEGFTHLDGDAADLGVDEVVASSKILLQVPQALTSGLVHSVVFGFVTETDSGDPLVTFKSAEWATGVWDARNHCLAAALSISEVSEDGRPEAGAAYFPNVVYEFWRGRFGRFEVRAIPHRLGVPVVAIPYRPSLDRPFGSSRISRPVMTLTDSAIRTLVRSEVSAEFFSAPQRYMLGVDQDAFTDADGNQVDRWVALLGRILTLSRDENGDIPSVGQFPQQSMEPHFAQLRTFATMFAAETNLPVSSLGVVQDNPASAEAIYAAKEELVIEVEHWEASVLSPALEQLMRLALAVWDDSPAAQAAYRGVKALWRSPATPSIVSASDAIVKQAAAVPGLGETDVALERLGYSPSEVARIQNQLRRQRATSGLEQLLVAAADGD